MDRRGHRMPLLTGVGAFRILAVPSAVFLIVSAVALTLYIEGPDLPHGETWRKVGYVGPVLALCLFVSPLALLAGAKTVWTVLRNAVATRASDVIFRETGVVVKGGRGGGFSASWDDVTHVRWNERQGLLVGARGARSLEVPPPRHEVERTTLHGFAETLTATLRGRAAGAVARRLPPNAIACGQCGAPVAPSIRAETLCGHCRSAVQLPAGLVEKMRSLELVTKARRADERHLRALRRQPPAWVANLIAFGGGITLLVAAVMTTVLCAGFAIIDGQEAGLPRMPGYGVIWLGVCLLVLAATRHLLSARRALRLLTLGFVALAPARPGEPYACHHCGGPLPEPRDDASLVDCAYCDHTSFRTVDLRLHAAALPSQLGARELIHHATRRRRVASVFAFVGAALVGIGGAWAALAPTPMQLAADDTVEVPFVNEKAPRSLDPVQPGPDAFSIERVARFGETSLQLLGGDHVDVVVREGYPVPTGRLRVHRLGASSPWLTVRSDAWRFAREGDQILFFRRDGVVAFAADGEEMVVPAAKLEDRRLMDLSLGPEGLVITTRRSPQGHFRLRDAAGRIVQHDVKEVSFGPDGTMLATALRDERWQLVMAEHLRATRGEVLTRGRGHVVCPRVSPDGGSVAFLSGTVRDAIQYGTRYGQREVFILDLEPRTLRQLTDGGRLERACPAWGPDGEIYAVTREKVSKTSAFEATVLRIRPR